MKQNNYKVILPNNTSKKLDNMYYKKLLKWCRKIIKYK